MNYKNALESLVCNIVLDHVFDDVQLAEAELNLKYPTFSWVVNENVVELYYRNKDNTLSKIQYNIETKSCQFLNGVNL